MSEALAPQETEDTTPFTNPTEFLQSFHQSPEYQQTLARRIKEARRRNPRLQSRAIESSFRDAEQYKQLLFDYYHRHHLNYDETQYSDTFNPALQEYWQSTLAYQDILGHNPSEAYIQAVELDRVAKHQDAAEELVKNGQAPNERVGRVLVHFLSVSEGIDNFDPYRDERRLDFLRFSQS